jgi:hypothetical protein
MVTVPQQTTTGTQAEKAPFQGLLEKRDEGCQQG